MELIIHLNSLEIVQCIFSRVAGGYNIHAVYNATHGKAADLKECKMGLKMSRPSLFVNFIKCGIVFLKKVQLMLDI